MTNVVTLKINDKDVTGRDDDTVLDIARQNGIFIPTLCHMEGLGDIGACRLCMIETKNSNRMQPACITVVQEGMEILTDTPRLNEYRKTIVQMMFAEGNHIC